MRKLMFAAAGLAALLAAPGAMASEKCNVAVDGTWPEAGKGVTVEAFTNGAGCEKATAVLTIHDGTGSLVYNSVTSAEYAMMLTGKKTSAEMEAALKEWIDQKGSTLKTTADLPEWKDGAEQPMLGEFPFYPEEGIDRAAYEKYRADKSPLFCFVPGIESLACVMKDKDSGAIVPVGAQAFPG